MRIFLIAGATLVLVALFIIKDTTLFRNKNAKGNQAANQAGLAYANETVGDLVNKDTDGDGIPDWEESVWGTDPTKADTVPGVPDSVTIQKLEAAKAAEESGQTTTTTQDSGNLTKTDQFTQELLATVTSLNQNGTMDQATEDQIGNSLAQNIQSSPQRKVYALTDLKVINSDTTATIQKYSNAFDGIFPKTQPKETVIDILQKLTADENNPDVSVLPELDPIIAQMNSIIAGMLKMNVPQSFTTLHLDVLNEFEEVAENLSDIQLFSTDPVVALGAITQYQTNSTALATDLSNLSSAISQKLNN